MGVRNPRIKSLIHFNSNNALPVTSSYSQYSLKTYSYNLIDDVPENRIQTIGTQWKYEPIQSFSLTDSESQEYTRYSPKKVATFKSPKDTTQSSFAMSPYPLILGGQDFTIEIALYINSDTQNAPIFAFIPYQNWYTKAGYNDNQPDYWPLTTSSTKATSLANLFALNFSGENFDLYLPTGLFPSNVSADNYNLISFHSPHYAYHHTSSFSNAYAYRGKYLQLIIVYRHAAKSIDEKLTIYINGFKVTDYKDENGNILNSAMNYQQSFYNNLNIPRTGFLYSFLGKYINKISTTTFDIKLDEFRICDGVALYETEYNAVENAYKLKTPDIVNTTGDVFISASAIDKWHYEIYQPKLVHHFDEVDQSNIILPPTITSSNVIPDLPQRGSFQQAIKFTENDIKHGTTSTRKYTTHQYLEIMQDNQYIADVENAIQNNNSDNILQSHFDNEDIIPIILSANDKNKYWKSGLSLGGRNFTIESFLKITNLQKDESEILKKMTIFEFNKNGCTDSNCYFRMIYDPNINALIVEQCGIIDPNYIELIRMTDIPEGQLFHWFIWYNYKISKLKLYVDKNDMEDEELISLYFPAQLSYNPNPNNSENGFRNETNEILANKVKEECHRSVSFPKIEFQQFLIASNVSPMYQSNDYPTSYPYSNGFLGTMEEFRIVDGHAVEPYTPERPYAIDDVTEDWSEEEIYDPDPILKINYIVVNEYKPTTILKVKFAASETYGPEEILKVNFKKSEEYGPEEILKVKFAASEAYGPEEILKVNFKKSEEYGPEEILKVNFKKSEEYGPEEILKVKFQTSEAYGPEEILKVKFEAKTPIKNYSPSEPILLINFKTSEKYLPVDIFKIKYSTYKLYEPELPIFIVKAKSVIPKYNYGPKELFKINFKAYKEIKKKNILKINFNTAIPGKYEPLEPILKLKFRTSFFLDYPDPRALFPTMRKPPESDDDLIIAVSFI